MKVLFFLLDGDTNASSQHRVVQYLPILREQGIEPHLSRPVPNPVYGRFVEYGRGTTAEKLGFYSLFLACRTLDVLRADRFDRVVIQRDLFPFGPPVLERWLWQRNPRLVLDTDDATYLRPPFTPNTVFQRLRRFDKVVEIARHARSVSAATREIADWMRQHTPNVSVVPMAVDLRAYDRVQREPAARTPVVLGWAGTAGGLRYLDALGPALRELAQRRSILVRVISGGYRRVELPGVPVDVRPWRPETQLEDLASFDIGLVPLNDSPFERAKFPFKLLQYLALGTPAVVARVGTAAELIRNGENGLLASASHEWCDALERLIDDLELRRRLAARGRDTVAAQFTIERVAPLFIEAVCR